MSVPSTRSPRREAKGPGLGDVLATASPEEDSTAKRTSTASGTGTGVPPLIVFDRVRTRPDQTVTRRRPDGSQAPFDEAVRVDQVFGRLRVLVVDRRLHGKRAAVVRCICGAPDKRVRIEHLRSGGIKSCGCLRTELMDRWRRLRQDDDAEVAAVQSRADERVPESDLLLVTLRRLHLL